MPFIVGAAALWAIGDPVVSAHIKFVLAAYAATIAAFLGGSVPEKEFLAGIEGEAVTATAERSCEAWYFTGQKRLLAGDRPGAKSAFEKAVATGAKVISAWSGARAELLSFHVVKK